MGHSADNPQINPGDSAVSACPPFHPVDNDPLDVNQPSSAHFLAPRGVQWARSSVSGAERIHLECVWPTTILLLTRDVVKPDLNLCARGRRSCGILCAGREGVIKRSHKLEIAAYVVVLGGHQRPWIIRGDCFMVVAINFYAAWS